MPKKIKDIQKLKVQTDEVTKNTICFEQMLIDAIPSPIFYKDANGVYLGGNKAFERFLGLSPEQFIGKTVYDISPADLAEKYDKADRDLLINSGVQTYETSVVYADRTRHDVVFNKAALTNAKGKVAGLIGVILDITEHKRLEEELVWKTAFLEAQVEATLDGILVVNEANKIILINKHLLDLWKVPQHLRDNDDDMPLLQYVTSITMYPKQFLAKVKYLYEQKNEISRDEVEFKDGMILDRYSSPVLSKDGKYYGRIWTFRDITDRKRMQEALQRAHDELEQRVVDRTQDLMRVNEDLRSEISDRKAAEDAHLKSEEKFRELVENINDVIYELDGKGIVEYVSPSVEHLFGYNQSETIGRSMIDFLYPQDILSAVKNLQSALAAYVEPREYRIRRRSGEIRWIRASSSPLRKGEQVVGVRGVLSDITERKEAEEKLKETLESLRHAVGVTVQVIAAAVEIKDPYTAGHQLRVADLARAIAVEMRLPKDQIDAIRMAGTIHDLGKLSIPAEILSKPVKLSEIEFSLIKEHARKGFEILLGVESPWPLAEIVYQHHERMDGSGYPRNLKGEEILMEARIIAIADVVESMASHRPYRPALGIEAALEEIENNRGTHYDNTIADACLKLFREKSFQLEES